MLTTVLHSFKSYSRAISPTQYHGDQTFSEEDCWLNCRTHSNHVQYTMCILLIADQIDQHIYWVLTLTKVLQPFERGRHSWIAIKAVQRKTCDLFVSYCQDWLETYALQRGAIFSTTAILNQDIQRISKQHNAETPTKCSNITGVTRNWTILISLYSHTRSLWKHHIQSWAGLDIWKECSLELLVLCSPDLVIHQNDQ